MGRRTQPFLLVTLVKDMTMTGRTAIFTYSTILVVLLLCGFTVLRPAAAQQQGAVVRWEYMTLELSANQDNYAHELNKQANRGWEYDGTLFQPYMRANGQSSDRIVRL